MGGQTESGCIILAGGTIISQGYTTGVQLGIIQGYNSKSGVCLKTGDMGVQVHRSKSERMETGLSQGVWGYGGAGLSQGVWGHRSKSGDMGYMSKSRDMGTQV